MALTYRNLDAETRALMVEEIERDAAADNSYISNYLATAGAQAWVGLLTTAAQNHDDAWLAGKLREPGMLKYETERRKPTGGTTMARVPVTAPDTMSEGEFNRFYVRAVCRRAIAAGVSTVIVYRARASENPRPESDALIGTAIDAQRLLDDLRNSPGVDAALGLARPNSGITVQLS